MSREAVVRATGAKFEDLLLMKSGKRDCDANEGGRDPRPIHLLKRDVSHNNTSKQVTSDR